MANILISSDSPLSISGVANEVRHIVLKLLEQKHKVTCIACKPNNKDNAKHTVQFNKQDVTIYHSAIYDDMQLISNVILTEKIDCLVLFTDPNKYAQVFHNAYHIRNKIPIYFVHVWDTYLTPQPKGKPHFNLPIYESVDSIGCISYQTEWFVNQVLGRSAEQTPPVAYVGHGRDQRTFRPMLPVEYASSRANVLNGKNYDFVVLMNSRNQHRKKFPDLIEAWRLFMEGLTKEEQAKCALLLKTDLLSPTGTNMIEVASCLAPDCNVHLQPSHLPEQEMAKLYNIADVTCQISNAEGFGLSINEAMLCGCPTITTACGGLLDQAAITPPFTPELIANLKNTIHGGWCYPIAGHRTIIGSVATPYLYDVNCDIDDVVNAIKYWYTIPKEERKRRGMLGREYAINNGFTAEAFATKVVRGIEQTINGFQPKQMFNLYKV